MEVRPDGTIGGYTDRPLFSTLCPVRGSGRQFASVISVDRHREGPLGWLDWDGSSKRRSGRDIEWHEDACSWKWNLRVLTAPFKMRRISVNGFGFDQTERFRKCNVFNLRVGVWFLSRSSWECKHEISLVSCEYEDAPGDGVGCVELEGIYWYCFDSIATWYEILWFACDVSFTWDNVFFFLGHWNRTHCSQYQNIKTVFVKFVLTGIMFVACCQMPSSCLYVLYLRNKSDYEACQRMISLIFGRELCYLAHCRCDTHEVVDGQSCHVRRVVAVDGIQPDDASAADFEEEWNDADGNKGGREGSDIAHLEGVR